MTPKHDFLYLACPYSSPEPHIKEQRFIAVTKAAAHLMRNGHIVYSPITHCHPMEVHGKLPAGWKFWRRIDEVYMRHSHMLVVLPLEGWDTSVGLKAEMKMANEFSIPILFIDTTTYQFNWEEIKAKKSRQLG